MYQSVINVESSMLADFLRYLVGEGLLPPGIDMLIGMDIITLGDFALTHKNNGTVFSFQIPSTHEYDFVKQIQNGVGTKSKKKTKKR